jgi:protein mraZ
METEFDKQGRVNLTATLKEHADLIKECVIVGVSNRIEIWSEDRWQKFADEADDNYDDIAEDLDDIEL